MLKVPTTPCLIPKIGIYVRVETLIDDPLEMLLVKVNLPSDDSIDYPLNHEELTKLMASGPLPKWKHTIALSLAISPLKLLDVGHVTVTILTEREEVTFSPLKFVSDVAGEVGGRSSNA